jgi:PhnB protein
MKRLPPPYARREREASMAVKPIPEGFHTVTPYLVVKSVAKLIDFLKRTFDAKVIEQHARPDGVIAHALVKVGDTHVMMGDATGGPNPREFTSALYVYVPNVDEVYKRALIAGATSRSEPANMFYGDRHGGVVDPCGNEWWIATHVEDVPTDEMQRRAEAHMKAQHKG